MYVCDPRADLFSPDVHTGLVNQLYTTMIKVKENLLQIMPFQMMMRTKSRGVVCFTLWIRLQNGCT